MDPEKLRELIEQDEFGLLDAPPKPVALTSDERLIAGFEEIQDFVAKHGREPVDDVANMAEATLAWRLQGIRADASQVEALRPIDKHGLLAPPAPPKSIDELLAADEFGLLGPANDEEVAAEAIFDTSLLPKPPAKQPDEYAEMRPAKDFERFAPMFEQVHDELRRGVRKLVEFRVEKNIEAGTFFVLRGVLCYVDAVGEAERDRHGKLNPRIRVVFENGNESNYLRRSFARGLYRFGRRVTDPEAAANAAMGLAPETAMGYVYVLRSLSDDPQITAIPHLYKIGFTKRSVRERLAGAADAITFLKAPVEVVAELKMPLVMAKRVERLLHKLFAPARLDATYEICGVSTGEATEWFSVPFKAIDEAIKLIENEAVASYRYDLESEKLVLDGPA